MAAVNPVQRQQGRHGRRVAPVPGNGGQPSDPTPIKASTAFRSGAESSVVTCQTTAGSTGPEFPQAHRL